MSPEAHAAEKDSRSIEKRDPETGAETEETPLTSAALRAMWKQ